MKRILTLFAAACALASCSQDEVVTPNIPTEKPTYYATFVDTEGESRTYLDENLKLLWHNDDRISLFATTYNEEYAFADPTGSNSGAFNAVVKDSYVTGNAISTTYAVYPYNAANAISNSEVLTIHFPAEQTYAENSFGRGANTMVAAAQSSTSKLLPFRNAGGYLMLKLYGENKTVKSIELKGNNEEVISGAATAEAKYGYLPSITMGNEGGKTITLTCEEAVTLGASEAEATVFWLVVPPITFEEGFTITVTDENGGTFTQSTSKEVVIERNEIKAMSALNPTFEGTTEDPEVTIPNNEIHYTATEQVTPNVTNAFGATYLAEESTYDSETQKGVLKFDGDVTTIGGRAFDGCSSLTSITIPDSVTEIGKGDNTVFHSCSSLKEFKGKFASSDGRCLIIDGLLHSFAPNGLTSYTIPDGATTIKCSAFKGCSSLTLMTIGNSVTTIEKSAFWDCSSLISVIILDSVTTIEANAFQGCSSLTSVTIGEGVTTIEEYAFPCSSLKEFKGKFASSDGRCLIIDGMLHSFARNGLTSYTIPDDVTTIGSSAFNGCSSLTSVTIPDSVTEIGSSAFKGCSSLTLITIPDSVTEIGENAFPRFSLKEFKGKFASSDGRCLIIDGMLHSFAPAGLTSYTIPDGVTEIGQYAFYGCSSLTSITIPDGVTEIGQHAFSGCSSLNSITIPDGVTEIRQYAFYVCSSLTSITIPDSITTIEKRSFESCSSLNSVTIPDGVTTIGEYAFSYCRALTSVTIPNSVTEIGQHAFYGCSSLTSVTFPEGITAIGDFVFRRCTSLVSVTIPDSVTSIGREAFGDCSTLAAVYCKPATPPTLYTQPTSSETFVFYGNASGRIIYVPASEDDSIINAYKAADGWKSYADSIEEYEF